MSHNVVSLSKLENGKWIARTTLFGAKLVTEGNSAYEADIALEAAIRAYYISLKPPYDYTTWHKNQNCE